VILVTHDLNVARNARRNIVLRDGEIVCDSTDVSQAARFLHHTDDEPEEAAIILPG